MGTRNKLMIAILIALLFLAGGKAMADGPVLDFTGGMTFDTFQETAGWELTVTTPITISALGLFDVGANGLSASHQIGLWTGSGTLLASATITTANSTPVASASFEGDWRFTPIVSLALAPGDYVVGATFVDNDPDQLELLANAPSTIAGVTFIEGRGVNGSGLIFPLFGLDPTAEAGIFGPNLFVGSLPAAVPEPNTVLLLGSGLLGLWGARKKFKK